jgi:hypothetical protein
LLGEPKPAEADPEGTHYTFERGVTKTTGESGWADVWMRGHFGWEYKGKHKKLAEAYQQLLRYREDLDTPQFWSCATSLAETPTTTFKPIDYNRGAAAAGGFMDVIGVCTDAPLIL